eukprot:362422-Pleurochrysis_carterae.AAC.2
MKQLSCTITRQRREECIHNSILWYVLSVKSLNGNTGVLSVKSVIPVPTDIAVGVTALEMVQLWPVRMDYAVAACGLMRRAEHLNKLIDLR